MNKPAKTNPASGNTKMSPGKNYQPAMKKLAVEDTLTIGESDTAESVSVAKTATALSSVNNGSDREKTQKEYLDDETPCS